MQHGAICIISVLSLLCNNHSQFNLSKFLFTCYTELEDSSRQMVVVFVSL